jgi:multisubunit Na+/H+ antiporter MnhC subunit
MPIETAMTLFAIVIPFAVFAGVLAWVQSRTGRIDAV